MSKRGQQATSSEGSPMAKPKLMNPAMAKSRPRNLVLHNPLSARKNPPQDLSGPVNLENAEEEQGGASSIRKLMRDPSRDPTEYSQVRRQETLKMQTPEDGDEVFELDWHQETGAGGEHKGGVS